MNVTYYDLLRGYVFKDGDHIEDIHNYIGYMVKQIKEGAEKGKWQLYNEICPFKNDSIYKYLRLSPSWLDKTEEHSIPLFETAEELTKEVMMLFKASPIKVGDTVRIRLRKGDENFYPFSFVHRMAEKEGKTFIVSEVRLCKSVTNDNLEKYKGDFHEYYLKENDKWTWHSTMFELVKEPEEQKLSTDSLKLPYQLRMKVSLFGNEYEISQSVDGYFLDSRKVLNSQAFRDAHIENKDAYCFEKGWTLKLYTGGDCPYIKDLESMNALIKDLKDIEQREFRNFTQTSLKPTKTEKPLTLEACRPTGQLKLTLTKKNIKKFNITL